MSAALSQLEREAPRILERLRRLELMDVPSAAKLLKTSPKWVRLNLPIVVLGPRQSRVRATDLEAYQERRTVRPKLSPSEFESVFAGKRPHIERMIQHAKTVQGK